jgi:hypothetical protein
MLESSSNGYIRKFKLYGVLEVRTAGVATTGYVALGSMDAIASGAVGGGGRLAIGNISGSGLVGVVDVQGLAFFPEAQRTSLSGLIASVGAGYRRHLSFLGGVTTGVHVSYGVSLLRVDGRWGNTSFDQEWYPGQVVILDLDIELPLGRAYVICFQPRYMAMPERGFLGHLVGGQLGVRYLW